MAFTSTIDGITPSGAKVKSWGTWTTDTTGGDIDTGLQWVENMTLTPSGAAASAGDCSVNETLPVNGRAVTIVVTSGVDGYWEALGTGM